MAEPIVYVDTSKIREGKLAEVEESVEELVPFVEANMPRLISYGFFFNEDRTEMTVVAVHPDSASLEYHLDMGKEEFRGFADLLDLLKIEVYGPVSDAVIERLNQKARMLGRGTVTVHEFYAGFARLPGGPEAA